MLVLYALCVSIASAQDDGLKLTGWPYQVDVVTENLGRFTEQSGWGAEFLPFPSNEYRDKMVASFVAGTEFDVAYVRDSYLAEWAAAGWILPINGLEGADELLADLPQGIIDQMSYEGEVYGLPYYSGTQVLAYNQAHFDDAGIMSPPETWDEMAEQAQMIKDAGIVEHPAELGPVCDASALRLVDVLAGNDVTVLLGVVPERPQLRGDREVDVLPVTRNSGVQRDRCELLFVLTHLVLP